MSRILALSLLLAFAVPAFAGEREELQLKKALLQEIILRARMEQQVAQTQLEQVTQQLAAIEKAKPKEENK